jgi:hypothetical protein
MEFQIAPSHLSPKGLNHFRQLQVLEWLREFRFSSPAMIGRLIDVPGPYTGNLHRFVQRMLRAGLLVDFRNEITPRLGTLLMAGPEARSFLEAYGRPTLGLLTNPVHLRRNKYVIHDLNVQGVALLRADPRRPTASNTDAEEVAPSRPANKQVIEILSENQLMVEEGGQAKPDLILVTPERRIAYEYEMTRKTDARIYYALTNHLRAIKAGSYAGVSYLFPDSRLRDKYEALYVAPLWPTTSRYEDGRVIAHGNPFNPDEILARGNPRVAGPKRITFTVECHLRTD